MSHTISFEVNDRTLFALQQMAAELGKTPAEVAGETIENLFAPSQIKKTGDFSRHIGAFASDTPMSVDNEQIDADLAREYLSNHEDE
jgi:hypothetical protein